MRVVFEKQCQKFQLELYRCFEKQVWQETLLEQAYLSHCNSVSASVSLEMV